MSDNFDWGSYWVEMIAALNDAGEIVARLDVEKSEGGKELRCVRLTAANNYE